MKVIFMLRAGTIEWDVPVTDPPFNFHVCVTQTMYSGYFLAGNLYIRHDELVGMSLLEGDKPVVRRGLQ